MLHIVNGDSTAAVLKQTGIAGECHAFREALIEGEPLLELRNLNANEFMHASFEITEKGKATLASGDNFIASSGIDLWLGGVHLRDRDNLWQWDGRTRSLVHNEI